MYEILLAIFASLSFMPLAFFFPTCVCCGTCTIYEDDFATDKTGTDYTTDSGTWSVSSGTLSTSSANARIRCTAVATELTGKVTCTVTSATNGDQSLIIGAYEDSDNYLFARYIFNSGSGALALFKRVGGTNTLLGSNTLASSGSGTTVAISLCWTEYSASVEASRSGSSVIANGVFTPTGYGAGLGTATITGTVTFDDFQFLVVSADCETCIACGKCDAGTTPTAWQVEFTSATGVWSCINGRTFVVGNPRCEVLTENLGGGCAALFYFEVGNTKAPFLFADDTTRVLVNTTPFGGTAAEGTYGNSGDCLTAGTASGTNGANTFSADVTPIA